MLQTELIQRDLAKCGYDDEWIYDDLAQGWQSIVEKGNIHADELDFIIINYHPRLYDTFNGCTVQANVGANHAFPFGTLTAVA